MKLRAFVLALTVSALSHAQQGPVSVKNIVVAEGSAYLVAPPRMVTDDLVDQFMVAPGGRYTLIWGQELAGKKFAPLFDAFAAKAQPVLPKPVFRIWDTERDTLLSIPLEPNKEAPSPTGLVWSVRPGVAFQSGMSDGPSDFPGVPVPATRGDIKSGGKSPQFVHQLWKLNASDGTFKPIASSTFDIPSEGQVFCSPTKQVVIVLTSVSERAANKDGVQTDLTIRVYDLDGKELKRAQTKQEGYLVFEQQWLADGLHLVGGAFKRGRETGQRKRTVVILDALTGTVTPTTETLAMYKPEEPEVPLVLSPGPVLAGTEKSEQKLSGLWLTASKPSEQPSCLVTAEFDNKGQLMPDMKSLLYVSRSRLYSCELAKMDLALYIQARDAAERTAALSKVKQIGTAVAIYGSDNNDIYPGTENWRSALEPYVKNDQIMDGFVYTFKGGSVNSIENPASTEIGYINVAGGRAVVYADTHAKYVKGK